MTLTYRGIQYNAALGFSAAESSGLTATYRGISYSVLKSNAVSTLPTKVLKYRGIVIGEPEVTYQPTNYTAMA